MLTMLLQNQPVPPCVGATQNLDTDKIDGAEEKGRGQTASVAGEVQDSDVSPSLARRASLPVCERIGIAIIDGGTVLLGRSRLAAKQRDGPGLPADHQGVAQQCKEIGVVRKRGSRHFLLRGWVWLHHLGIQAQARTPQHGDYNRKSDDQISSSSLRRPNLPASFRRNDG
jgi:hypothetical protein